MRIQVIGHDQISARQYLLWEKMRLLDLAEVEVLAPERWRDEVADAGYVTAVPTSFADDISNYMMQVEPHVARFKPDWILSMTELWRQQTLINLHVAKKYNAKIAFYRWENLPIDDLLPEPQQRIEKQALTHGDLICCGTQSALDITKPRTKIPLMKIPETGIEVDVFKPSQKPRQNRILYVGRNALEKGIKIIKEAVETLPYEFVAVHGDQEYGELAELMGTSRVGVVGSVDQPNWQEQFCYVIGEMLACGLPVVSTDSGAIPEIWGECGAVRLVQQNNVLVLREAIQEAMNNPPDSELGVQFVRERYSNDVIAKQYAAMLEVHS